MKLLRNLPTAIFCVSVLVLAQTPANGYAQAEGAPINSPLPSPELPYLCGDVDRETKGRALAEAIAALRADAQRRSFTDATQRRRAETESLLAWSERSGHVIEPYQFLDYVRDRSEGDSVLEGGTEHDVLYDPDSDRAIKLTHPNRFGLYHAPGDYLANLDRCNRLFDDDIRFEGTVDLFDGLQLVTSQPFIPGRRATEREVADYFEELGFQPDGGAFIHPFKGLRVTDVKGKNVLIDNEGYVFPIDVHVASSH